MLNNCTLAYENLGALYNDLGLYQYAIDLLEKARAMYIMDAEIVRQLGIAYYKTGNIKSAKNMLRRAEELRPGCSASFLASVGATNFLQ